MVGGADDPLLLHPLDQRGGAVVADAETALDIGRRGLAIAQDDRYRLIVRIGGILQVAGPGRSAAVLVLVVVLRDRLQILRRALRLEMGDDRLDLTIGNEGAMDTLDASAAGHIEHVAHAEKLLGPL